MYSKYVLSWNKSSYNHEFDVIWDKEIKNYFNVNIIKVPEQSRNKGMEKLVHAKAATEKGNAKFKIH